MSTTQKLDAQFFDKGGATINAMHSDFDPDTTDRTTRANTVQRAINYSKGLSNPRPVYVPEALFNYDASAVTFDADVRMVAEATNPNLADLRSFGASIDGVTDDEAAWSGAFLVAAANSRRIYVPVGTTFLGSAPTVDAPVTIFGVGFQSVIDFRGIGDLTGSGVFDFDTVDSVRFNNLTLHGDGQQNHLDFSGCSDVVVDNVQFREDPDFNTNHIAVRATESDAGNGPTRTGFCVKECVFKVAGGAVLVQASAGEEIHEIRLLHNDVRADNANRAVSGVLKVDLHVEDIEIVGNFIDGGNTYQDGIGVEEDARDIRSRDNVVRDVTRHAYRIFEGQGALPVKGFHSSGDRAISPGTDGMNIGASGTTFEDFQIVGFSCRGAGGDGIETSGSCDGFLVANPDIIDYANEGIRTRFSDTNIRGGRCRSTQAGAIGIVNQQGSGMIHGVDVQDNPGGGISSNSGVSIRNCSGFVTEGRGSDLVAVSSTGTFQDTIAHGMDVTPDLNTVTLTLDRETDVDDYEIGFLRVVSVDATSITYQIRVVSASATGTATVRVRATCRGRL